MDYLTDLANDEEIDSYNQSLQDFFAQKMDVDRFTATRLQMGIYGQRQDGVNMVRIKVPGGRLNISQLDAIADVIEKHVQSGEAHVTTRQDIQLHYVPLADTPAVIRHLAKGGLTTREACGNTIRNVTACPLTGVCSREHTDISQHLGGVVRHFLRKPLNQLMPRKFKMSFSGCEADCAQAMIHDLGVVAVQQGDRFGFKVLVGGGLGHKPHEAIVIESFAEEKDLLLIVEAVLTMHNKYSDRNKRAKARIKFLVDKFGVDGFVEKYREELARVKSVLADQGYPKGDWALGNRASEVPGPGAPRKLFAQKQAGLFVVPISVPLGQVTAKQVRGIAKLLRQHDLKEIRTTQDQNLMLVDVPEAKIAGIQTTLNELGLSLPKAGDNVVACPGTSTCRLGITSSPTVGAKLTGGKDDLRIRVSGCHNGCAQPESGDIGIYGEGKRMYGKLVPHYQMYFGGDGMAEGGLAFKGPSVPSARVEVAVDRVQSAYATNRQNGESFFNWTRRVGQGYFTELLADVIEVKQEDLHAVLRDHGQGDDFRVLQLGGGECAGAKQLQIGTAFFDAANERNYRNALKFQRKLEDSLKCAEEIARLISQGLAQLVGGKKFENLSEQAEELKRVLPTKPNLAVGLAKFAQAFSTPAEELTDSALTEWYAALDEWTAEVADFCIDFDRQLDLAGALPKSVSSIPMKHAQQSTTAL